MQRIRFTTAIAATTIILASAIAASGDTVTLRAIMQGLRDDVVKVTNGLLTNDFELIANGAEGIARHPRIPAEQVKRVAAELGDEMPSFKQLDTHVHELSLEIKSAAANADADAALSAYLQLIEGCVACHNAYKDRVSGALGNDAEL